MLTPPLSPSTRRFVPMTQNLEEQASWLSKIFFWWAWPVLKMGYKEPLQLVRLSGRLCFLR